MSRTSLVRVVAIVAALGLLTSGCVSGIGKDALDRQRKLGYFQWDKAAPYLNEGYTSRMGEFLLAQTYM